MPCIRPNNLGGRQAATESFELGSHIYSDCKMKTMILQKLGSTYQLSLDTPEDLEQITRLDEALWAIASAPCENFTCDPAFLRYIDIDGNGRIRTDEVRKAWEWMSSVLSDKSALGSHDKILKLDSINTDVPAGREIRGAAERVLHNLKIEDVKQISLAQIRNRKEILSKADCNGDGVIPPTAVSDENVRALVAMIMETLGSSEDASGQKGVTAELLGKFMDEGKAITEWRAKATGNNPVTFLGDRTAELFAKFAAVKNKIDDFFRMSDILTVDSRMQSRCLPSEEDLKNLNTGAPGKLDEYLSECPIAPPEPGAQLRIDKQVNPFYMDALEDFFVYVLPEFTEQEDAKSLNRETWEKIKSGFRPREQWLKGKKGTVLESIPEKELEAILNGKTPGKLKKIIDRDLAAAAEIDQVNNVEKLILLQAEFLDFANNFVSLRELFDPRQPCLFQEGTLVMDGRHFDLTMKVTDKSSHRGVAEKSNICTMYLRLSDRENGKEQSMEVAAAITSGNVNNLYVGKHGIFIGRGGRTWDAKVTDIVKHPVSVSEALRLPFVKLGSFIGKQFEKFTGSSYQNLEKSVGSGIENVQKGISAQQQQAGGTGGSAWGPMGFLVLGGGLSIAAVGSAFAYIAGKLKDPATIKILAIVLAGVLCIVALPIIIATIIKLRRRNISMFIEACGWSVNSSLRLSHKMGLLFTRTPAPPAGSRKTRKDIVGSLLKNVSLQKDRIHSICVAALILILLALGLAAGTLLGGMLGF